MYVGENESVKFCLSIMNGLKNRGVDDILIAYIDKLSCFHQATEGVFPKTEVQHRIIRQIRNATGGCIVQGYKSPNGYEYMRQLLKRVYFQNWNGFKRFGVINTPRYTNIEVIIGSCYPMI